jgi:hypothetical protein
MELYERVDIWRRANSSVVRYVILRRHDDRKVAIQSADFFYLPVDPKQTAQFEQQFVELLAEISPLDRCSWHETFEDAISYHEQDFGRLED